MIKKKDTLEISNLHANIGDLKILNGINLTIKSGEIHAIMGPNGSGKSTLCNVLMGHPKYEVTKGIWCCSKCSLFEDHKIKPTPTTTKSKKYWIAVDENGNFCTDMIGDPFLFSLKRNALNYDANYPIAVRATLTWNIERVKK